MANEEFVEKLLKERYCIHNDNDGDERVGDIWDNICGRVANYLGDTDDEVNAFHDMVYRKEFLPNSPTLMNAGTAHPMLSACFKAGTMIETNTIPTPIELIKIGDVVLSHDGTYNKVTNVMRREDFIYKVKIDKLPPLYVTKEHPVFTNNGWKCIKDLSPKQDFVKIISPIVTPKIHTIAFDGIEVDGLTHVKITNKDSISQKKRRHNLQTNPIKNNIVVDKDLSWFLGMYLAEGSISQGYDVRFTLNINEQDYAYKIISILKNKFGLKSNVKETLQPTTWLTVRCHSKFLATWLDTNFGHGFNKKYIPSWVYRLDHSCIHSLIQGVDDGDGSNSNYKSRQIILCNEPLVRQLFTLIKMVGYSPTLRIWKMPKLGTTLPCQIQYKHHNIGMVINSDYYRVKSIEPLDEKCNVYNFEVENTHTYVANQIAVHNCFYLPISDCISNGEDGIFDQVKNAAIIFKYGGGVGLNFSNLRPAGSTVHSTQGVSSGVISFMKNFNTMTETIKQGGKRRGALMGCLDITHPEIKSFINCKTTEGDLSNFNISVKLTDEFMKSVENNSKEELELFNMIIDGIYKNGEPGILFKDEIERYNPRPDLGELSPNPCAEALLPAFGSCNLGSINWSCLYNNNSYKTWEDNINWERYDRIIRDATILLNRVIDKNEYPLLEIDKISKLLRQIGLGGMGFHDLLLKQKIPYDSALALDVAKGLMYRLKEKSKEESLNSNFNNSTLTTIAPTGTISIIADVSSGIEPVFNWVITRKDSLGEHYIIHPIFETELMKECQNNAYINSDTTSPSILYDSVIKHCHKKGTIQDIDWLSTEFKELFKNAMDISWVQHIKMQSVFQTNGVDMSISKTINLPNNATKKDIRNAIFMAWKMKCKGITIYRSGSRENEVLNLEKKDSKLTPTHLEKVLPEIKELYDLQPRSLLDPSIKPITNAIAKKEPKGIAPKEDPFKRPRHLYGVTYKIQSGCGKLYVTINERNGKPYEVFIQSGGSGGCEAGNQALGRAISLTLRSGGGIRDIIKQLIKVKCPAAIRNIKSEGKSCSDIVGKLLKESIPDEDEDERDDDNNNADDEIIKKTYDSVEFEECPECHEKTLIRESGCKVCHSCGYNKCG